MLSSSWRNNESQCMGHRGGHCSFLHHILIVARYYRKIVFCYKMSKQTNKGACVCVYVCCVCICTCACVCDYKWGSVQIVLINLWIPITYLFLVTTNQITFTNFSIMFFVIEKMEDLSIPQKNMCPPASCQNLWILTLSSKGSPKDRWEEWALDSGIDAYKTEPS